MISIRVLDTYLQRKNVAENFLKSFDVLFPQQLPESQGQIDTISAFPLTVFWKVNTVYSINSSRSSNSSIGSTRQLIV
jgi:hypothetical protein